MAKKIDAKLKRQIIDVSKSVAAWVFVTAASFGYWLVVLLIASLVLLNVWHVTFDSILKYSFVLMIITSVVYLGFEMTVEGLCYGLTVTINEFKIPDEIYPEFFWR